MGRRRDILERRNAARLEELLVMQDPNQMASTPPSQYKHPHDDSGTTCLVPDQASRCIIDVRDEDDQATSPVLPFLSNLDRLASELAI